MGDARRKKLAGYVPEPKPEPIKPQRSKVGMVGYGGLSSMAILALLMADYHPHSYFNQR